MSISLFPQTVKYLFTKIRNNNYIWFERYLTDKAFMGWGNRPWAVICSIHLRKAKCRGHNPLE